jgi:hypothetical protein
MRKGDKNPKKEKRKKNKTINESRARTGRDRKGEDDYYFKQEQEVAPN